MSGGWDTSSVDSYCVDVI